MRPSTSPKALWAFGLLTVLPAGTPRAAAISGVTFTPGSMPPRPGLAPWLSLISMARTGADSTVSRSLGRLKPPSGSRQPKYPVPIW